MARRHRRYSGITSISLNGLTDYLSSNVKVMDVGVGVIVGVGVAALVKGALNKFAPDMYAKVRDTLGQAVPFVSSLAAGAVLYYAQRNMNRSRGTAHAVGAIAAGLAVTTLAYLPKLTAATGLPLDFSEVVAINLNGLGGYGGLLVDDAVKAQYNGLLVADKSDALNELAAYSMGDSDDDGLSSLGGR